MGYTIPEIEPEEIIAGDLITWKKSLSDYPASAGWTLKYSLRGGGTTIDIIATVDGDDHLISIPKATTAAWQAGTYRWQSYIEKGAERYTLNFGTIIIKPSFEALAANYDTRSHVKKVLDALESIIAGKATADVAQYTIAGRSLTKFSPEELIKWRDYYSDKYQTELSRENIKNNKAARNRIKVRL